MRPVRALLILCLWLMSAVVWGHSDDMTSAPVKVAYPDIQHPYYAERDRYFHALLKLALEKSGEAYQMVPVPLPEYSENRSVHFITSEQYDVHWLNTTRDRETKLLPIRIPLYKGAIGWRAFIIKPSMQKAFARVRSVKDLRKFIAAQGHDWADLEILRANDLPVEPSANWEGMFTMVKLDRVQYFPRSIVEILDESRLPAAHGLTIEDTLILKYPAAYYFFVKPGNTELARILEKGLQAAVADKSFDELFARFFGDRILPLNLEKRRILSVPNPMLEKQMPLDRPELWFSLGTLSVGSP